MSVGTENEINGIVNNFELPFNAKASTQGFILTIPYSETPTLLNPNKFICELCPGRSFSNLSNLNRHVDAAHNTERPFSCNLCNKCFTKSRSLDRHVKTHNKKFTCKKCPERHFSTEWGLNEHIDIFHETKKHYICITCNQTFTKSYQLKKHIRCHNKLFTCETCPDRHFSTSANLESHVARCHKNERPYSCQFCEKRFYNTTVLKYHIRSHVGNKKKTFVCELCSKSFFRDAHLKVHLRIHTGEKPFKCLDCPKTFPCQDRLKDHQQRSHTKVKPFCCETCGKCFVSKVELVRHVRIHTKERPYSCTMCDKSFRQSGALTVHYRIHLHEKPYECEICLKKFTQEAGLWRHKKTHLKKETTFFIESEVNH